MYSEIYTEMFNQWGYFGSVFSRLSGVGCFYY